MPTLCFIKSRLQAGDNPFGVCVMVTQQDEPVTKSQRIKQIIDLSCQHFRVRYKGGTRIQESCLAIQGPVCNHLHTQPRASTPTFGLFYFGIC